MSQVSESPTLVASIERTAAAVQVEWSVTNSTGRPIWVADRLLAHSDRGAVVVPERAVVRQPPAPQAPLRITVGYTAPYSMPFQELYPAVREIAPGEQFKARIGMPLPLNSYHPMESKGESIGGPSKATLAVGYWTEAPPSERVDVAGIPMDVLLPAGVGSQQWLEQGLVWP